MSKTRLGKERKERFWKAIQDTDLSWALKDMLEIEQLQVRLWVTQLRLYREHLKKLNDKLEKLLDEIPSAKSVRAIKGIGPTLTSLLFYNLGLGMPLHRDEFSIKLGASPVFIGSGNTRTGALKGYVMMRKTLSSSAKGLTYMIGLQLIKHSKWAHAMFENGRSRNQRTGTIYRRICRCFLRIVTSMMKHGTEYDESRYIEALVKNGVPWAKSLTPQVL